MAPTYSPHAHSTDADDIRLRVDTALSAFIDRQEARFDAMITDSDSRLEWQRAIASLRAFLAGGKRLRPAFCYWGWRGADGDPGDERVITAAASLELLHAFALIHDDIIDESDTRRGAPSLQRQHAMLHEHSGRAGRPELFGNSVALLLGDLCIGWFHEMLAEAGLTRSYPKT